MTLRQYYADPHVRERIREYLGAAAGRAPTAAYVASLRMHDARPVVWEHARRQPASEVDVPCREGADIARSLLDSDNLIFLLELDYLNPDAPAEPFTHPAEVLFKLEPAYQAVRRVLDSFGLKAYSLATGRGYHFTARIPVTAPVLDGLADLVPGIPAWVDTIESRRNPGMSYSVPPRVARAWTGLGCLVEYLANLVITAAPRGAIPLVFNGTTVGTGLVGRECVSIDFSYVGDPLDARYTRCAFSAYQWHRFRPDIFGVTAARVPEMAAMPRNRRALLSFMRAGRSLEAGRQAARRGRAMLPDASVAMQKVLAQYLASPLAAFHRRFYAGRRQPAAVSMPEGLPPCALACLAQPNDLLLRPEHLQHLVRTLLARGWSAAQVSALVETTYLADHEWGERWRLSMDPATRAAFDVRVFAGMIASGADRLVDFNCVSAQEKGLCPGRACTANLRDDAERLARMLPVQDSGR